MKTTALFLLAITCFATAAYAGTRWTQADIATYCHANFGADDRTHGYQGCMERNKSKLNHDKTPAEQDEINAEKAADPDVASSAASIQPTTPMQLRRHPPVNPANPSTPSNQ